MEKIAIKLNIANRIYPMKIDRNSEEYVRKAIKNVAERLKKFYESNYAIKDKQDLLAMCLIEYASKLETLEKNDIIDSDQKDSLIKIEDMLDAVL